MSYHKEKIEAYLNTADIINMNTHENDKVFIVKRGDDGGFIFHERYYCCPRTVDGGSMGPVA